MSLERNKTIYRQNADHPDIAASLHNLGMVSQVRCKFGEAEKWYQESLEMRKRIYGQSADHLDIAESLYQLGRVFQEKGEFGEAEKKSKNIEENTGTERRSPSISA